MRNKRFLSFSFLAFLFTFFFLSTITYGASEQFKGKIYDTGILKPVDSRTRLKAGMPAPSFTLPSITGEKISLADYRGKKNVVISFVPAAWTPVCSDQWPGYNILKDVFDKNNAVLLGVTVDNLPTLNAWTKEMGDLWFPVLSDFWPHGAVAKKYGVLRKEGHSERAIFILDKEGIVRYVDIHDIDKQPDNDELFRFIRKMDPQAALWAAAHPDTGLAQPNADVVMYCTSWCPGCKRARLFFQANNITFSEVDITLDRDAAARVRGWADGNETTPTFNIRGQVLVNYDERKLKELLGLPL